MVSRAIIYLFLPLLVLILLLSGCSPPRAQLEPVYSSAATAAPESSESVIYAYLDQGRSRKESGDLSAAIQAYRHAYRALTPNTSPSLKGIVLNELGAALVASNAYDEAIPVCHSALLINLACHNEIEAAVSHLHLGDAISGRGKPSVARQHWEKAYEIAKRIGHSGLIKAAQTRTVAVLSHF